jgi:crotonobetainyl-CoA:carnitine CoA-transferase CaiB-like acyl-CoA transferase
MDDGPLALLQGVRIVDLTSTLSGPYGTLLLGDLGAEVIKIESPGGDPIRDIGPRHSPDMGAIFLNLNRNKQSVVLDLTTDHGRDQLRRLCEGADVAIHNMRPSAAVRCGADASTLRHGHPELIHCAIRGFGEGPYGDLAAYDDVIQAASGMAAQQAWVGGHPQYSASGVADKVAGMFAALAIAAALYRRSVTGVGSAIDIPMFETVTSFAMVEHLYGWTFVPPKGEPRYPRQGTPMRRPFRTADGYVAVVVYTNEHWARFFELIGRPELAHDERFMTLGSRTEHLDDVLQVVEDALAGGTSDEWVERLGTAGIPARKYVTVEGLFEDPHLAEVNFFRRQAHPTEGELLQVPTPIIVDGAVAGPGRPVSHLGQDSDEVLGP